MVHELLLNDKEISFPELTSSRGERVYTAGRHRVQRGVNMNTAWVSQHELLIDTSQPVASVNVGNAGSRC